jgi:hypothetical protein
VEEMNLGTDSQRKKTKVFAIGVDRDTFDIILPLVERGELPNLKND